MKRAALIIIGFAVVSVLALGAMCYVLLQRLTKDENTARTEAARKARWPEKSNEVETPPVTETPPAETQNT